MPEILLPINARRVGEYIERYGSIGLARALKEEGEKVQGGQHDMEKSVHALLRKPEHTLELCQLFDNRIHRHQELLARLETRIKSLSASDTVASKNALHLLSTWAANQTKENTHSSDEVRKILMHIGLEGHDEEELQRVLGATLDVMKMQVARATYVDESITITTIDGLRKARDEYLQSIESERNTLIEMLDREIQARAARVYESLQKQWNEQCCDKENPELLEQHGVTNEGLQQRFLQHISTVTSILRIQKKESPIQQEDLLPGAKDPSYLQHAKNALQSLATLEKRLQATSDGRSYVWIEQVAREERMKEERVKKICLKIQQVVDDTAIPLKEDQRKTLRKFLDIYAEPGGVNQTTIAEWQQNVRTIPSSEIDRWEKLIDITHASPHILHAVPMIDGSVDVPSVENIQSQKDQFLSWLPALEEHLTHDVCTYLGIREQLQKRKAIIVGNITIASEHRTSVRGKKAWQAAQSDIVALKSCLDQLGKAYDESSDSIERLSQEVYTQQIDEHGQAPHPDSRGFYDANRQKIYINIDACKRNDTIIHHVIEHERGHQVIDILSKKSHVFPGLFDSAQRRLKIEMNRRGESYDDIAQKMCSAWGYTYTPGDKRSEDNFLEELLMRHADYVSGRSTDRSEDELKLYQYVEQNHDEPDSASGVLNVRKYNVETEPSNRGSRTNDAGEDDTSEESEGHGVRNHRKEIHDLGAVLARIDGFFDVYPERANDPGVAELRASLSEAHQLMEQKLENGEDPVSFEREISAVSAAARDLEKEIKKFDHTQWDLTEAAASQKKGGWKSIISNVHWMSLSDIGIMFSEAWEDTQRMWKRRGEGVRATVGKKIFGAIPENLPYIGRLASEFAGREQSSEQEEVGVWEKRYETVDSRTLQNDILPKSRSKDEIKAILNLLTKRGRLDWNYEGLWDVLESVSDYHMPHAACKRDPLLRDMYLQKLIANIWTDKDQHRSWKNANDSGINSGKSDHKATVDSLSATSQGLSSRLKYLLEKYVAQSKGATLSAEEEVDPHLYEAILHYAMENGKMSMEDKIFYLIQGVAHGIMNMDRMQAFVGVQGEILNSFPFIDYFNGKTYDDVMVMAKKLGYPENLVPDERTAHFMMDEIATDDNARARAKKALKSPQNIDHEDMPLLISMYDHKAISDLVAVTSGCTPKISMPGMQNIFVGYNSIFQYYAIRAKMAKEHGAPFSNHDARECAKLMAAFANFDNRVTIKGDPNERPTLSFNNINDEVPVSGSVKTKEYRDRAVDFVHQVAGAYGIQNAGSMPLEKFVRRRLEDSQNANFRECNNQTALFDQSIQSAALADKSKLIDILASFADRAPEAGGFIPENADYTYSNATRFLRSKVEKKIRNRSVSLGSSLATSA